MAEPTVAGADVARLFIAAVPPDDVLDAVEALARPDEPGVRYSTRDQWHVTLRFLGKASIAAATAALREIDAPAAEAVLGPQVSKLGRTVVVAPVAGLEAMAAAVLDATGSIGEPPDFPTFTGHLTIARLKNRGACRIAGEPISARFAVDEIHLVRSHQHPKGSRYEVVASHRLAPHDAG